MSSRFGVIGGNITIFDNFFLLNDTCGLNIVYYGDHSLDRLGPSRRKEQ